MRTENDYLLQIRYLIEKFGSQGKVARKLGVDSRCIGRYLDGARTPAHHIHIRLLNLYEKTLDKS